jgi:signal transduction histidine kinase
MKTLYSIRTGLTGFALLFIAGTSIVMGVAGSRFASEFLTRRYHESFKLLAENLSKNAELGVLLNDGEDLKRLVSNMLDQGDVRRVTILSSKGYVLAEERSMAGGYEMDKVEVPILTPSMGQVDYVQERGGGLETVGVVVMGYSLKSLDSLRKKLISSLVVSSLVLSFLSFIWYWFFAKSVSKPLEELVDISRQVSAGNMDVRAKGGRYYETQTLATTFNEMLGALKQNQTALETAYGEMAQQRSMAELGKFSMMVAHEIKNPLSIIRGSVDILKKEGLSSDLRLEMLKYQEEEIERINRLVEDFLIFAKPLKPAFEATEMSSFVRNLAQKVDTLWHGRGISISWEGIEAPEVWMACDRSLFDRALTNILKNGFEACAPGDRLELSAESDGSSWCLSIGDTGPGLDLDRGEDIFEPFYTTRSKGTGLGLSIVKEIVELHKGTIVAENRVDRGAVFKIILPWEQNILSAEVIDG